MPGPQENDLKSEVIKIIEALKRENKTLKEIQENTFKLVKELNIYFKELQETTIKQEKERKKTVQDLKMKLEEIKKTQSEVVLEVKNLGKRTGTTDISIIDRI